MGRTLLAGVLAGIALFAWGAIAHMALGLDEQFMKSLPDEVAMMAVMSETIEQRGMYFFPGTLPASKASNKAEKDAADQEWMQSYASGPHGILIYSPPRGPLAFGRLMAVGLAVDVLVGVVVAMLLAMSTPSSFGKRFAFVALVGVVAWLAVAVPYWNWYDFPTEFTRSQLIDLVGGFCVAGLVLAAIVKPRVRVA